jgi:hypothetical protein
MPRIEKENNMLIIGIIILLISSVLRAWGIMNYSRWPGNPSLLFLRYGKSSLALYTLFTQMIGLISAMIIGYSSSSFITGLLCFLAFWFLSGIWVPMLEKIGL